jgi:hypothetical protein
MSQPDARLERGQVPHVGRRPSAPREGHPPSVTRRNTKGGIARCKGGQTERATHARAHLHFLEKTPTRLLGKGDPIWEVVVLAICGHGILRLLCGRILVSNESVNNK